MGKHFRSLVKGYTGGPAKQSRWENRPYVGLHQLVVVLSSKLMFVCLSHHRVLCMCVSVCVCVCVT